MVVVAGPKNDYLQPAVDALKNFVEGGGRAMFLLDPPLKIGKATPDNEALDKVLQDWGVSLDKDLLLDTNPVGQLLGAGPQVALVSKYDSHPIVDDMKGTTTGFPPFAIADDQEHGTKEQLFKSSLSPRNPVSATTNSK